MTAGAKYFQQRNQKMLGRLPVICSTQSQNLGIIYVDIFQWIFTYFYKETFLVMGELLF